MPVDKFSPILKTCMCLIAVINQLLTVTFPYFRRCITMTDTPVVNSNHHKTSQSPAISNGNCVASKEIEKDCDSEQSQTGFGYLRFYPGRLQFLAGARWFLLFMCLATFSRTLVNGLLGATMSTLERRFALSSSQTAWIAAAYEIAGTPALVIGYFGSKLRRPLWIGGGMFLFGVGVGIYTIPHFVAPPYRYVDSTDSGNLCVDDKIDNSQVSSLQSLQVDPTYDVTVMLLYTES